MTTNKREIGQENRTRALYVLARLGYATTRQLAFGVWGECTDSTRKMAGRLIRRLLQARLVVERRDDQNDERMVALTAAGAAELAHQDEGLPGGKPHARDWLRHAHAHRTASNSTYLAMASRLGSLEAGWTEIEIHNGRAPADLAKYRYKHDGLERAKVPDVLYDKDGQRVWVEVENTWRSAPDLAKVVAFLRELFRATPAPVQVVWFVVTVPGARTIGSRIRTALTHYDPTDGTPRQVRELDARILQQIRVLELDQEAFTLAIIPH